MVLTTTGAYGADTEADTSKEMKQLGLGSEAPKKAKSVKKGTRSTSSAMKGRK